MRIDGYLEHLPLGVDPDSGERNILVQSVQEYQALTPEEKERAWSTIKVASEIQEVTAAVLYKHAYSGKMASKIIKKNEWDRHGLTLIKIPTIPRTKEVRRAADIQRIVRVVRRSIKATKWVPSNQKLLIEVIVNTKLRNIERELFGSKEGKDGNNKGITEEGNGNHEHHQEK
jgi:hypothetical protein